MKGKKGGVTFCRAKKLIHQIGWIVIMNIHGTMSLIYITLQCFTRVSLHLQLDINSTVAL